MIMTSRELILNTCDLPSVPMVATKILKLVRDPTATLDDIQKAIIADEALASRILKIANSAFYGTRQNIDTISRAVSIMGFNTIKTLTLAVSSRDVYKRFGIIEQKLWEHSLGVSVAAGILASQNPQVNNEESVVAGLLHDIGKVIMNNSQPERFSILMQRVYNERVPFTSIEKDYFGFSHAEAGYLLAEKWGFPKILCDVILNHHACGSNNTADIDDPCLYSLCSVIALSDALCARLGIGYRGPMADLDLHEDRLRDALGISAERYGEITNAFKNAYVLEKISFMD